MHESERHRTIERMLQERPFVSVTTLVETLSTSEATIRRDLRRMHASRLLHRVRGGAQSLTTRSPAALTGQPAFTADATRNVGSKRAIARRAAELCLPGSAVIIDAGTTTAMMSEFLPHRGLAVLTNSFPVAVHLVHHTENQVMIPGGEIYRNQRIILNSFEDLILQNYHATLLFLGTQGLGPHGLLQTDPLLAKAQRHLLEHTERVVVLADSSKAPGQGSIMTCPLSRIDILITDSGLSKTRAKTLTDAGIDLIVVNPE